MDEEVRIPLSFSLWERMESTSEEKVVELLEDHKEIMANVFDPLRKSMDLIDSISVYMKEIDSYQARTTCSLLCDIILLCLKYLQAISESKENTPSFERYLSGIEGSIDIFTTELGKFRFTESDYDINDFDLLRQVNNNFTPDFYPNTRHLPDLFIDAVTSRL